MKKILMAVSLIAVVLVGCNSEIKETETTSVKEGAASIEIEKVVDVPEVPVETEVTNGGEEVEEVEGVEIILPEEEIDLQVVKPNEVGEIMLIMYHSIQNKDGYMIRSVENFREDLERLYAEGYRPISMADYINNNISVEAGYTPFVLTFDDGHRTNFQFLEGTLENEEPTVDPDSAVGILMDFNERYEDFDLKGIFYLNGGSRFGKDGLSEYKIKKLVEMGLEIGNHTYGHEDLGKASVETIQKTIGQNQIELQAIVPGVTINSLALPFGGKSDKEAFQAAYSGEYNDVPYKHDAVLNVGWKPERPMYHTKCNSKMLNRVQSGDDEFQLGYWLDNYLNVPRKRYISDGDPQVITVEDGNEKYIDRSLIGEKTVRTYKIEE